MKITNEAMNHQDGSPGPSRNANGASKKEASQEVASPSSKPAKRNKAFGKGKGVGKEPAASSPGKGKRSKRKRSRKAKTAQATEGEHASEENQATGEEHATEEDQVTEGEHETEAALSTNWYSGWDIGEQQPKVIDHPLGRFFKLPVELHLDIVELLEYSTLERLRFTCHWFRNLKSKKYVAQAREKEIEELFAVEVRAKPIYGNKFFYDPENIFNYPCYTCFRELPLRFFDDTQVVFHLEIGKERARERRCADCALATGKWKLGSYHHRLYRPYVSCRLCRRFKAPGKVKGLCYECSRLMTCAEFDINRPAKNETKWQAKNRYQRRVDWKWARRWVLRMTERNPDLNYYLGLDIEELDRHFRIPEPYSFIEWTWNQSKVLSEADAEKKKYDLEASRRAAQRQYRSRR